MGIKTFAAKAFAKMEVAKIKKWANNPILAQDTTFKYLLNQLKLTQYGFDQNASLISTYDHFKQNIPAVDYEQLRPYIDQIKSGASDVLWPGKPKYFCKTSGTTSGTKYIPMSDEGIKAQIKAARNALMCYLIETGNVQFMNGKMIFLQGSPDMEKIHGIAVGRLSGIVAHHIPRYLQANRMPSWETNSIENWEQKIDAIVDETLHEKMTLISGIPPWVQMYFERLIEKSGKKSVLEIFPDFSVFVHGGVNFEPYKSTMKKLIGRDIDSIETYPASEGFIAFQDSQKEDGLLLNLDAGIFYEFIPIDEIHSQVPTRISLSEVQLGINYAIVLNTSSGLWGYVIGDTIKFVNKNPYRLIVTGRIKHYISAFGEHVIAEEVEKAMIETAAQFGVMIQEFHVAPQVNPSAGLPYHEWFIEAEEPIPSAFAQSLDIAMRKQNSYYNDLIVGAVLRQLEIKVLPKGAFNRYMERMGKLGGQNKLPRLSNDRSIADALRM